jgi:endonuclease/exonuclease/phosphatase (EEP) superfamily protein YafD
MNDWYKFIIASLHVKSADVFIFEATLTVVMMVIMMLMVVMMVKTWRMQASSETTKFCGELSSALNILSGAAGCDLQARIF